LATHHGFAPPITLLVSALTSNNFLPSSAADYARLVTSLCAMSSSRSRDFTGAFTDGTLTELCVVIVTRLCVVGGGNLAWIEVEGYPIWIPRRIIRRLRRRCRN
jgi:hypothetical protein